MRLPSVQGLFHSLVLKADGTVETWGYDFYGQCDVPVVCQMWWRLPAGLFQSGFEKMMDTVAAWGDDYYGQPTILRPHQCRGIGAGGLHGLALKRDGTMEGWVPEAQLISHKISARKCTGGLNQVR